MLEHSNRKCTSVSTNPVFTYPTYPVHSGYISVPTKFYLQAVIRGPNLSKHSSVHWVGDIVM